MTWLGRFQYGDTVEFNFTTALNGVPTALSSGALRCYKNASTTQDTGALTMTVDFDSVTGLNHVSVDTDDTGADATDFFANGNQYDIVIDTGTIGGVAILGTLVGRFMLGHTPDTGAVDVAKWLGTTVNANTAGVPSVDAVRIDGVAAAAASLSRWLANAVSSSATSNGTTTTLIDTALTDADDIWVGATVIFNTGNNDKCARTVIDFDAASDTLTLAPALPNATASGDTYVIIPWGGPLINATGYARGDTGGIADAVYAKGINDTGVYALVDRFDTGVNSRINQFDTGINSRVSQLSNKVDTGAPSSVWDEADAGHTDTGTFGRLRQGVNVNKIDGDTGPADNLGRIAGDTGANSYIPNSIWNALTANHGDTGTFGEELQGISVDFEAGLLDLANGVETGLTVRQALRLFSAILGGKVSGAGTSTEVFRNAVADDTDRVTATVDPSGNRVTITLDLS